MTSIISDEVGLDGVGIGVGVGVVIVTNCALRKMDTGICKKIFGSVVGLELFVN